MSSGNFVNSFMGIKCFVFLWFSRSWSWHGCGWCLRFAGAEVDLRGDAVAFVGLEVGVVAGKAAHAGDKAVGEERDVSVVVLYHFVVAAALDGDAVFCSGQFVLEAEK